MEKVVGEYLPFTVKSLPTTCQRNGKDAEYLREVLHRPPTTRKSGSALWLKFNLM
jgi:hypothetical protein